MQRPAMAVTATAAATVEMAMATPASTPLRAILLAAIMWWATVMLDAVHMEWQRLVMQAFMQRRHVIRWPRHNICRNTRKITQKTGEFRFDIVRKHTMTKPQSDENTPNDRPTDRNHFWMKTNFQFLKIKRKKKNFNWSVERPRMQCNRPNQLTTVSNIFKKFKVLRFTTWDAFCVQFRFEFRAVKICLVFRSLIFTFRISDLLRFHSLVNCFHSMGSLQNRNQSVSTWKNDNKNALRVIDKFRFASSRSSALFRRQWLI